ncbi:MAG: glycosyltransferase family 4 protein [Ilumatobacter sp.]|nr:glycosyltransferase family 4 protein [Ilumatobacter sp.]
MTIDVCVNLTWIAPGRVGGSEQYLARQLLGLEAIGADLDVRIECTASFERVHTKLAERFPFDTTPIDRDNRAVRIALEHTWLAARTRHADVVHHGGGTTPMIGRRPIVLTIHDLQYRRFPEYFSAGRRRYLDLMMPRSVDRAAVVATPTAYVRQRVVDVFGADPERVVVVPHGVPPVPTPDDGAIERVGATLGIDGRPYVVYPAITHPHKRHDLLVRMLEHADDDVMVVLTGGAGRGEPELRSVLATSPVADRVVRPGRIAETDLHALIAGAVALAFPSEYEGFGAPLVEAMALGTPVIASDAPAVREVVGDAGIIVEHGPDAPAAWAAAVGEMRTDRDTWAERGHARRAAFTIETSGAAIEAAYRRAVEVGA